ncbi:MAG: hypothetical protein K2P58_11910 [Hyphomonadaceae bacterium]|nr:hypothetical protein [Hyphomonadaceae bacterium]
MNTAEKILRDGVALLEPTLSSYGFSFKLTDRGMSSGGEFANGRFKCDDRELRLSYRSSLGLVTYKKGKLELSHDQYMRALKRHAVARYPGFGQKPMDAFADLLSDLKYCGSFLEENGEDFVSLASTYVDPPKGFRRLADK